MARVSIDELVHVLRTAAATQRVYSVRLEEYTHDGHVASVRVFSLDLRQAPHFEDDDNDDDTMIEPDESGGGGGGGGGGDEGGDGDGGESGEEEESSAPPPHDQHAVAARIRAIIARLESLGASRLKPLVHNGKLGDCYAVAVRSAPEDPKDVQALRDELGVLAALAALDGKPFGRRGATVNYGGGASARSTLVRRLKAGLV